MFIVVYIYAFKNEDTMNYKCIKHFDEILKGLKHEAAISI